MNAVTLIVAVILNLSVIVKGQTCNNAFAKRQETLSCEVQPTKTIPPNAPGTDATFCHFSCVEASTETCKCIGWRTAEGSCKLCLKCTGGGIASPMKATFVAQPACPDNYQGRLGTDYCYRLLESDLQSGVDAQTQCANHASDYPGVSSLASIRDETTLNWIRTFFQARLATITNGLWIGLYDTGNDAFAWRDGRPFCPWITNDSVNCGPDNPWVGFPNGKNQRPGQESCVTLHHRVWNETDCSNIFPFYCAGVAEAGVCPVGYAFPFPAGHCFGQVRSTIVWKKFTEAGKYCVTKGYQHLWSERSKAYTQAIAGALSENDPNNFWIGLRTDGSGTYYWMDKPNEIGLRKNTFWKTGQPDGGMNSQQCVAMSVQDGGKWSDEDCAATKPYICQYKIP